MYVYTAWVKPVNWLRHILIIWSADMRGHATDHKTQLDHQKVSLAQ